MKRIILVARNVLLNKKQKILLGQRADSGKWELPGGKIDNEPLLVGAKREQMEETGMKLLGEPRLLGCVDVWHNNRHYLDVFLAWCSFEGKPFLAEPDKQLEWRWFDPQDLPGPHECTKSTAWFLGQATCPDGEAFQSNGGILIAGV